jgi:cytochrome c oxidase subunit III
MSKNTSFQNDPFWIEKLRQMHPFKLFLWIAIIGIAIMFTLLTLAYLTTKPPHSTFFIPVWFAVSSIFIVLSSFSLSKSPEYYRKDEIKKLHLSLVLTFLFGLAFIYAQMRGWKELNQQGIYLGGKVSGSYLFLLSGLHLIHFLGGVIYFLFVYFRVFNAYRDKVKNLIYVTDPYEWMLLDLLTTYWHFVGVLWLLMYFVFILVK